MVRLGPTQSMLDQYPILHKEHLKSSTALLNPNEPGSSRVRLSWIWQSNMPGNSASPASLRECELLVPMLFNTLRFSVNRVHWIRARAQKDRWREEYTLVGYEMQWTVRHHLHSAKMWENRRDSARRVTDLGAAAYACRKIAMWMDMAQAAHRKFTLVNVLHPSLAQLS